MRAELKRQLLAEATAPYRATGFIDLQWARGKLRYDPIFATILDRGLIPDDAQVMDIGCGRGLLAAWVLAAEQLAASNRWSAPVPPPLRTRFAGVELMAREADCGNRALQARFGSRVQLSGGDMREASLPPAQVVAMLDVLHYVPFADQDRLLDRIRASLESGGVFITRVGDAHAGQRFRYSQVVDRCISFIQGHRLARMWCRPLAQWVEALEARGFIVQATPMTEGPPLANVMLVARVP
ncbi:methyltransferase domain-containing protein [Aquabacterium sp.]|uniref:methyltransferase domain-containing protein n=1 Tax=Aquabacterium sp. TaxID=1872578 RepID=UPI0035AF9716